MSILFDSKYVYIHNFGSKSNADGPFSYTGFKPAWIMIKRTDSANSWTIRDSKRSTFNVMQKSLFADLNNAESDSADYNFDFLSNGFKQRNANGIDKITEIPFDPHVAVCSETGIPFVQGKPESTAAAAFRVLGQTISNYNA